MIVDSPNIHAIAVGAGRVIPQEGDAQVYIPPVITPVLDIIQAHQVFGASNGNSGGSNATSLTVTRNNQAGSTLQLQLVGKGLYRVQVNLSTWFDFTPATPILGASVRFGIGNSTNRFTMAAHWARLGNFDSQAEYWILAPDDLIFDLVVATTGVADNLGAIASVNAARIL